MDKNDIPVNEDGFFVPSTMDHFSRMFGYNFARGQFDPFETPFPDMEYINDGGKTYIRGKAYADYMQNIPTILSNWTHTTGDDYDRGAA